MLGEVSAYERLKMQCLYVVGIMTECLLGEMSIAGLHCHAIKK